MVATLAGKCERALNHTGEKALVIAGGVGANQRLRTTLNELCNKLGATVYFPRPEFCTDNAAMIACLGSARMALGQSDQDLAVRIKPRWRLSELD